MGYHVTFQYMSIYTVQWQIRIVGMPITSDIYHFFMLATFEIHSTSYFEIL